MFDRANPDALARSSIVAHGGAGEISFCRVVDAAGMQGECNFLDLVELPPGGAGGRHGLLNTGAEPRREVFPRFDARGSVAGGSSAIDPTSAPPPALRTRASLRAL